MLRRVHLELVLALNISASQSCVGYKGALGYRAHQAVLTRDVEAFQELMEEASETFPKGPRDNPKKTVLTHFLDLAADPRFFPTIEAWKKKGWVDDDMICSIHRAHHRLVRENDPVAAQRSIDVCLDVARMAARVPDRAWQVNDCLEGAAFLTQTATSALVPFVALAIDPAEPLRFRVGLFDGMTRIPISTPGRRLGNDSSLSPEDARRQAAEELALVEARFTWIIRRALPSADIPALATGTAIGAMEIEATSVALGRSFIGAAAASEDPYLGDLAWAWVRVMKNKKRVAKLASLGLWNRERETRENVFWYVCTREVGETPAPLVEAVSLRASVEIAEPEAVRATTCLDAESGAAYPTIIGPFPLEAIALAVARQRLGAKRPHVPEITLLLKRRLLLDP